VGSPDDVEVGGARMRFTAGTTICSEATIRIRQTPRFSPATDASPIAGQRTFSEASQTLPQGRIWWGS
jgi:hypothetical protein